MPRVDLIKEHLIQEGMLVLSIFLANSIREN
jgi:hypothetical protein